VQTTDCTSVEANKKLFANSNTDMNVIIISS